MQTVIMDAQELTVTLPGMTLDMAESLLVQADAYYIGETEDMAIFIATSRTDFGELLHEAKWTVTSMGHDGYLVDRVLSD